MVPLITPAFCRSVPAGTGHRPDRPAPQPPALGRPGRHRVRPLLLAAGTAVAVLLGTGAPGSALAATTPVDWSAAGSVALVGAGAVPAGRAALPVTGASVPQSPAFRAAVRTLQPFVHRTPAGTYALDAPQRVVAAIPADVYAQLRQSSALVNQDIAAGRLISLPDGRIVLPSADDLLRRTPGGTAAGALRPGALLPGAVIAPALPAGIRPGAVRPGTVLPRTATTGTAPSTGTAASGALTSAATTGATSTAAATSTGNSITVHWWGVSIHLDNATATQLIGALTGAATVTSILTVLVSAGVISSAAAVPLAIVSGILALVTAALQACVAPNGMDLSVTWLVFGWCTPAP